MSTKEVIHTDKSPAAIGPYSQAVKAGSTVYISGQIPLDPDTMELVDGDITVQAHMGPMSVTGHPDREPVKAGVAFIARR